MFMVDTLFISLIDTNNRIVKNIKSTNNLPSVASPSFIEAPSDVEVNEGGSVKLPCRAQGRPKPRIIWDRIGGSVVLQSHQQQMGGKIPQYMEKETQEDLLAKAKIMSLRLKRSIPQNIHPIEHIERKAEAHSAVFFDRSNQNGRAQETFDQIMRNENREEALKSNRRKRQTVNNDGKSDDTVDNGDTRSPDSIPILVFSTQPPQEVSRLQITDSGELILLDVTERDQVN